MQAPIVEDSAIVTKILWARLERAGFQLVTLDIVMPGVDGLDAVSVLTRIRKEAFHAAVFVVSARNSLDDCDRFIQAGAMGSISKPFIDFEKFRDQLIKLFPLV
jgi:CheY-like chemotaxis protein